ncbi:hypothetical protein ACEPAH_9265 [Sanghuangporus vaninii]
MFPSPPSPTHPTSRAHIPTGARLKVADREGERTERTRKMSVDVKRSKGQIACAECRRLKLRCDKNVPCGSCTRRGCRAICPNGVLSSGQGSRGPIKFILSDTDELHAKITEMSKRIRQLEDALANLQATVSRDRHPLLEPDLLAIKHSLNCLRRERNDESSGKNPDEPDKGVLRSFEDLTLEETDLKRQNFIAVQSEDVEHFATSSPLSTLNFPKE